MTPKNQQELEKLIKARDAKTRMSAKAFKARALEAKEQCLALQKEAEMAALAPGISDAEKAEAWDRAHAYSVLAGEWERTARLPSDAREAEETKGLLNQNADKKDRAEHRREEIRQVYKSGMSAGDVVNALRRAKLGDYKRSTIEKDLKKIRGRVR